MMPSLLGTNMASIPHAGLSTDALLNELSRQLATANSQRYSRGSSGYSHRSGNAMRITKPTSANTSPKSALLQARRRTMMSDGMNSRPPPPMLEAYLPTPAASDIYCSPSRRAARPVSWHPGSQHLTVTHPQPHPQPQTAQQSAQQSMFPAYNDGDFYSTMLELPPTPAAHSGLTSPASNFSPLAFPYANLESRNAETPGYFAPAHAHWAIPGHHDLPALDPTCTAPPTPDNTVPIHQPLNTKLAREENIPFQSLDEAKDEAEGEILYGMGLYDTPASPEGAQLRYHRSTVMSLLGGVVSAPESQGRGLKLEDAWEPPPSDDEEDEEGEDDEDDEDADGEDLEEE